MSRLTAATWLALPLLAFSAAQLCAAPTGLLNDTGQDTCYDGTNLVACTIANSGDAATYPRQDGRFGRDAKAVAGTLAKTGAGAKGFDYTKVCFNGDLEGSGTCTGTLVANTTAAATGTPSTDWACTKDNVTNLIWSLQSISGANWTDATTTHPDTANTAGRCGFATGWRPPTRRELLSIVNYGTYGPAIDGAYFPSTGGFSRYWSSDDYGGDSTIAWDVYFYNGEPYPINKTSTRYVRLVRSGL